MSAVVPATGATGVATDAALVFTFSLPMDVDVPVFPSVPPFLVGNLEFTPSSVASEYDCNWGGDGKTLSCEVTWDRRAPRFWRRNIFGRVRRALAAAAFGSGLTGWPCSEIL